MVRTYAEQIIKNLENLKIVAIFHPRLALAGVLSEIENVVRETYPREKLVARWREEHREDPHPDTSVVQRLIKDFSKREDLFPPRTRTFLSYVYERGGELRHTRPQVLGKEVKEMVSEAITFIHCLQSEKCHDTCANHHPYLFSLSEVLSQPLGPRSFQCATCGAHLFTFDTGKANELPDYDVLLEFVGLKRRDLARQAADIFSSLLIQGTATRQKYVPRPPIVVVAGATGHGKTKLVASMLEAPEEHATTIAHQIGAYTGSIQQRPIVFLDAPPTEATRLIQVFKEVADLMLLVVACSEGVTPQTVEGIRYAREIKVPIIVAINKVDEAGASPDRVKHLLAEHGLHAEDWGGDAVMVEVSATQKTNLNLLIEMILLVTDIQDLKAEPNFQGVGTVLDVQFVRGRGPVATILIRNGTMRLGDSLCGVTNYGRVTSMCDDWGNSIEEAPPSTLIEFSGLKGVPGSGENVLGNRPTP